MKKLLISLLLSLIYSFSNTAYSMDWESDILYSQIGSCENNNLAFNAARFTKMPLHKTRDGLELYLQLIVFIKANGSFRTRIIEQGLGSCQTTKEGEVCSYRPYPDTKQFIEGTYLVNNDKIILPKIGTITKIRDDYPWQGYNIELSSDFLYEDLSSQNFLGGKIQINFNDQDTNVSRICK